MYSQLPHQIQSRNGFEGCLASLDLNGESPDTTIDALVPSLLVVPGCEGLSNANLLTDEINSPDIEPTQVAAPIRFPLKSVTPIPNVYTKNNSLMVPGFTECGYFSLSR